MVLFNFKLKVQLLFSALAMFMLVVASNLFHFTCIMFCFDKRLKVLCNFSPKFCSVIQFHSLKKVFIYSKTKCFLKEGKRNKKNSIKNVKLEKYIYYRDLNKSISQQFLIEL